MWRLAVFLIVIAITLSVAAWLISGKTVYKRWAIRLGQLGLAAVLLIFGLLILERLTGG